MAVSSRKRICRQSCILSQYSKVSSVPFTSCHCCCSFIWVFFIATAVSITSFPLRYEKQGEQWSRPNRLSASSICDFIISSRAHFKYSCGYLFSIAHVTFPSRERCELVHECVPLWESCLRKTFYISFGAVAAKPSSADVHGVTIIPWRNRTAIVWKVP